MIYLLFAIAGVMSIITAAVINSISSQPKSSNLKKIIVVGVSLLIYIAIAIYLLSQNGYN